MQEYLKNCKKGRNITVIIPAAKAGQKHIDAIKNQIRCVRSRYPNAQVILIDGEAKLRHKINEKVSFVTNKHHSSTGPAYSISLGLEKAKFKTVLVIYSDIIFDASIMDEIKPGYSMVVVDESPERSKKVGLVVNQEITNFSYDLPSLWGGIFSMSGNELLQFKKIMDAQHHKKWLTHEVLNKIIELGGIFKPIFSNVKELA